MTSAPNSLVRGRARADARSGQIILIATLSLSFMFGVMGLATDLGLALYYKQNGQAAADAAAIGAINYALKTGNYSCGTNGVVCGTAFTCPSPVGSVTSNLLAGCAYAASNGFTNSGSQTVSLIANNTSVNGVSSQYWVQATVTQSVGQSFLFAVGHLNLTSGAHATAGISSTGTTNNPSCIYALSAASAPGGSGAGSAVSFVDSASGNVSTSQCGINVNGNFSYSGSGNINTTRINANGNLSVSGSGNIKATGSILYNGSYSRTGSGSVSPAPALGAGAVTDPFASLPAPTVGACTQTNYSFSSSSNATISKGVYCGGMSVSGSGNLTLNPGTYIVLGGFNYSGSGNLSGNGVTIYITGNSSYPIAPVKLTGSGNMNLSAPVSGTYQGILFFQDRTQTYATANSITGSGNVASGSFYFPTTELDYSGSGNAVYQALIANVIKMTGSGNLKNDSSGQYTGLVQTSSVIFQ